MVDDVIVVDDMLFLLLTAMMLKMLTMLMTMMIDFDIGVFIPMESVESFIVTSGSYG